MTITRDGGQEGSARGYNPNHKGCNSHHPLMAFISQTRMVRGDSGFYTDEILSTLEERSLNYIIAARAYANLKNESEV